MEKIIKMSLETARKFWKDDKAEPLKQWLLENFTKEELEQKEGFVWEDCYPLTGFYFDNKPESGIIQQVSGKSLLFVNCNKHVYKTEAQAKAAIAFAQLSHIVAKYNEGKTRERKCICFAIALSSAGKDPLEVCIVRYTGETLLVFEKMKDAELSLKVNNALWRELWGV